MAIKRNKIRAELSNYGLYMFLGVPKSGKTSLTTKIAETAYGSTDAQLLVSFSDEEGYHSIDDILVERINDWDEEEYESETDFDEEGNPVVYRGFVQLVDELVETKKTNGFKIITLDTFDKLVEVGIKEVLRISRKETGKKAKSLNDALNGYGRGRDKLVELILEQINRLISAKYVVFVISHIKKKEMTDVITGESYEVITNNLRSDVYSQLANIAQMITMLTIDRIVEEGKQVGSTRTMWFRSNGMLDCGCRFPDMPEKLPLSAENFMLAFETGVKNSMKKKVTDEEIKEMAVKEQQQINQQQIDQTPAPSPKKEKAEQPTLDKATLLKELQEKCKQNDDILEKAKLKINALGFKNFKEMSEEDLTLVLETL